MLLVYKDILDRVENYQKYKDVYEDNGAKTLIENFELKNLQAASYDITMSDRIMVQNDIVKTIRLSSRFDVNNMFVSKEIREKYILKPSEYILVSIKEKINMPDDLAAHIRPRTTFNRLGLIIASQYLNPSYSGNLQIGIKNMTHNAIEIEPGLMIGQIVFEKLSGAVEIEKLYRNKQNAKYQDESGEYIHSKIYDEASELYKRLVEEYSNE